MEEAFGHCLYGMDVPTTQITFSGEVPAMRELPAFLLATLISTRTLGDEPRAASAMREMLAGAASSLVRHPSPNQKQIIRRTAKDNCVSPRKLRLLKMRQAVGTAIRSGADRKLGIWPDSSDERPAFHSDHLDRKDDAGQAQLFIFSSCCTDWHSRMAVVRCNFSARLDSLGGALLLIFIKLNSSQKAIMASVPKDLSPGVVGQALMSPGMQEHGARWGGVDWCGRLVQRLM